MKKLFSFFIMVLSVISIIGLCACGDDIFLPFWPSQLSEPKNLQYENGLLKWDSVNHALDYVLLIDAKEYTINTNTFELASIDLPTGEHEASVRTVGNGNYKSSEFSKKILFDY